MLWRSVRYLPLARTVQTRNMAGITQQLADVAIAAKDAVVNAVAPATAEEPKVDDNVNEFGNNLSTKSGAKKEAKRLAALAKAQAKTPKHVNAPGTGAKKKEKKEEKVVEHKPFVNTTPPGEKKDVMGDMTKDAAYDPTAVEAAHYEWWKAKGFFKPQFGPDGGIKPEGVFVIPAPPPNVTGALHIGHALTISLQDTMIRWARMKGKTVLFNPGYDHAGIATQAVVENRLIKTEGKTRHDYGREAFIEKVWDWKDVYQAKISEQMGRLGASYDWDRTRFTMDPDLCEAVTEAFCQMHEKGLIYRANRLVNWCVYLNTTLSNLEVDQKELTGRTLMNVKGYGDKERFEFGAITSFAYQIEGSDERIIVATTRPETMLGDTAVAVHPEDPRYTHLHGKFVIHPFLDRRIPIVTDDITVDMAFGTGAVKITPAHDANDYECGKRHNLEFINLMNDDGTYNANAGPYEGMKRFHVRNKILEDLKERGLYIETKDNPMQIPICSRSGDVIEAIMKPQWWVSCAPMAKDVMDRTNAGELEIKPQTSAGEWKRWMENMQDWCISRQLWWGHRCPAYLFKLQGQTVDTADPSNWIVARSAEAAEAEAKKRADGKAYTLSQDDDVLDTWFSSGLWPFSIMGWPKKTADLEMFYPNTVLETGWDILFFWVARMAFMGVTLTGQMPFKEVYCHAMIRDAYGRKMSKSLGNVIDPLDIINGTHLQKLHDDLRAGNLQEKEILKAEEGQKKLFPKGIPQCGTDALRFTLANYSAGGRDIALEILRVEGYRKFCNKMWNATKFCLFRMGMMDLEGHRQAGTFVPHASGLPTGKESLAEKWILHKLNECAIAVDSALEFRDFFEASNAAYKFFLNELCDVYIEASKPMFEDGASAEEALSAQNTLYTALEGGLKLLHPFMPFVTEDLWQRLPRRAEDKCESIMISTWPAAESAMENAQAERDFELVLECAKVARSIVSFYGLPTKAKTPEERNFLIVQTKASRAMLETQVPIILALAKTAGIAGVSFAETVDEVEAGCGTEVVTSDVTLHIPVKGKVDAQEEISKLEKKQALVVAGADKIRKLAAQDNYETAVKPEVREANKEKLEKAEVEIETLRVAIERFQSLL